MINIVSTPDVRSGQFRIENTRVTVGDILDFIRAGMTIQNICDAHNLTHAQIDAALDYVAAHPEDVR